MRHHYLLLIIFLCTLGLNAQNNLKPVDFQLGTGVLIIDEHELTIDEIRKIAPSSSIFEHPKNSPLESGLFLYQNRNPLFFAGLGLAIGKNPEKAKKINVGISYFKSNIAWQRVNWSESFRLDTSENVVYRDTIYDQLFNDSVYSMHYDYKLSKSNFRIDLTLQLFQSNWEKKFGIYGGAGLSGGITFNNHLNEYKFDSKEYEYLDENGVVVDTESIYEEQNIDDLMNLADQRESNFQLKNSYSASINLLLGMKLDLVKGKLKSGRLYLFYELMPSFTFFGNPELNETQTSWLIHNRLGLRLNLNDTGSASGKH